jgi:hypothetical protein
VAGFHFTPQLAERQLQLDVTATDRAGSETVRTLPVKMRWMNTEGGHVLAPDGLLQLHVSDASAGVGRLAILYSMTGHERPPGSGDDPVYQVDLLRSRELNAPVALNFLTAGAGDSGVLRWNPLAGVWEEIPTLTDPETGWLAVAVSRLGAFRVGSVSATSRRSLDQMQLYPNPFVVESAGAVRILYRIAVAGPARMQIYNSLGHPVRSLVSQSKAVGTWSTIWDGTDQAGKAVASGVYFLDLAVPSGRRRATITVLR